VSVVLTGHDLVRHDLVPGVELPAVAIQRGELSAVVAP
jgi:hypothetical protein